MNKTEFMEGIHILQNNYNQKFSTEKLRLYYEHLQDMDKQEYLDNISKLLKTNEFMPNIAQIRGEENRKAYPKRFLLTILVCPFKPFQNGRTEIRCPT